MFKKDLLLIASSSIFMVCFVFYQIFGKTGNIEWTIFFECMFYIPAIGFLTKEAIFNEHYKRLFALYDAIVIILMFVQFFYIGGSIEKHTNREILNEPYYFMPVVMLIIFVTFILTKIKAKR